MPSRLSHFRKELKRRNVFRVITVYAGAAFVIIELINNIAEPLHLPDWTPTFFIVILAIGFPVVALLSWVYDLQPDKGSGEGAHESATRKASNEVSESEPQAGNTNANKANGGMISWKIATYASWIVILSLVAINLFGHRPGRGIDDSLEKSIAVLPFNNWSNDEKYAHLGKAMADEIILQLQYISEFDRVISSTSTARYEDTDLTLPEIAAELGVNYIIEGSIQPREDQVSIKVQVIQCIPEDHVWADEFDGRWSEIFLIQDRIAKEVASELKTVLSPEEIGRIDKQPTRNIEAYNLYLLGKNECNKRTKEGLLKSISYYEQAIKLDSLYAVAYAGLAESFFVASDWNYMRFETGAPIAKAYALKANELDETLADPYATLAGLLEFYFDGEPGFSDVLYRTAIRLNPNFASAFQWFGLELVSRGQMERGVDMVKHALEIDPFSAIINFALGLAYYYAEDFDEAISQLNRTIEMFPDFDASWIIMLFCMLQKGDGPGAIQSYGQLLCDKDQEVFMSRASSIYESSGIEAAAEYMSLWEENSEDPDLHRLSVLYAYSGNREKGLGQIEYNANHKVSDFLFIPVEPAFEIFHSEPRFQAVIRELGH